MTLRRARGATQICFTHPANIYVNGRKVYRRLHLWPLAWQESFAVDVTDAIRPGEANTIAIHGHDEYGMGGLWKPTALYTE